MDGEKILMFLGYYYPSIGGVQKTVSELSSRLIALGYEITIITCNTENVTTFERVGNLEIIRLPCWNILNRTYPIPKPTFLSMKILSVVIKTKFNLIITHTRFYPLCFTGLLIAKIKKIPLIHTEHGSQHTVSKNYLVSLIGRIYDHSIGFLIVRFSNQNICISYKTDGFVKHLGAKKSIVIHNGIDLSDYTYLSKKNIKSLNDALIITYLGRLIYSKGIQDIISIIPEINKKIKLLIIGEGSYRSELERLSHITGQNKIEFLGERNYKDIPQILANTDIFVNPSYSEGLPTSVLEACAAGCAVVATDVGGTNEIVHDQVTGFLIHPGNRQELVEKINFLIEDRVIRDTLGKKAKEYIINNFSWDQIIWRWVIEINHLCNDDVEFDKENTEKMKHL